MPNAYFTDIHQYADVESTNIYDVLRQEGKTEAEVLHILQERSRDNARTPMQWDDSANGGFSDAAPWLQSAESYRTVNVQNDRKDPDSIFAFYQKLIRTRKEMPVVQEGIFVPMLEDHPDVFAYQRSWNQETAVDLESTAGEVILANYPDPVISSHMTLRPYETIVFYQKEA